ncbi:hypothetical protein [Pseudozobellia sp. WGM2]|uniref:hypothetical protein n=1 Tax=Pseudozobellia sp. WGM2 TaxID=2787625 RepID=UPI001ADF3047|nr:hypothetical protein [Pseudozobellia sp. WGM2]
MKKCIYLLCAASFMFTISCSKEKDEITLVTGEAQIKSETGLSFVNSSGFSADFVNYKLRYGTGLEKEYGQSLVGYNHIQLQQGTKTIYQIEVFKDGSKVPFKAYINDDSGNEVEVKSTSIIDIDPDEILEILLDDQ